MGKERQKVVRQAYGFTTFNDGDIVICYCPDLDVYGYGKTENEAELSLGISVAEVYRYGYLAKMTS